MWIIGGRGRWQDFRPKRHLTGTGAHAVWPEFARAHRPVDRDLRVRREPPSGGRVSATTGCWAGWVLAAVDRGRPVWGFRWLPGVSWLEHVDLADLRFHRGVGRRGRVAGDDRQPAWGQ